MAKSKYSSTHHLQKFFIIFGVLFSLAALGIIVFASQKPTNTQSDASGGCLMTPHVVLVGTKNLDKSVIFNLKIKNNSSADCNKKLYYVEDHLGKDVIPPYWLYKFQTNGYGVLSPGASKTESIEVVPSATLAKGVYYPKFRFCRTVPDFSKYNVYDAYHKGLTENCAIIKAIYNKD